MSKTKELFESEKEKISLNEINKNTRELLYMRSMNFKEIFQEVQVICNQPKNNLMMEEAKLLKLLEYLEECVLTENQFSHDMDVVSWGYEEGILISGNEAITIIEVLKAQIKNQNTI